MLQDHTCIPSYPQVTCAPGTTLSGTTCIVEVVPEVVPNQDRIIADLHGQSVNIPAGPSGLRAWSFSFPTEFHAIVIEKQTEAGDVLQLDTRTQLEDFNNHERYTLWLTVVYRRVSSTWRFESAAVSDSVAGWMDSKPVPVAEPGELGQERGVPGGVDGRGSGGRRLPGASQAGGRRPGQR